MADPISGIMGGVSLFGASQQSNATRAAADTQAEGTRAATAKNARQYDLNRETEQTRFDQNRADRAPYMEAGRKYLGLLASEMDQPITEQSVMNSPGYQFGLKQGQQGLDRKFAAAGGRVSGAALKAASEYNTNYATTGYNAEYQRRQDRLQRLGVLSGMGQVAPSGSMGQQPNNGNASLISSGADAQGAAQIAQGNIWGNATNQLGAAASRWVNQPTQFSPQQVQSANSWNVPQYAPDAPDAW